MMRSRGRGLDLGLEMLSSLRKPGFLGYLGALDLLCLGFSSTGSPPIAT